MAVCTYANHKENLFKKEYPSEPILANSAACYFNQIKHFKNKSQSGLSFLVNKLSHAVQNSIIDQGEKGETISKILLQNAFVTSVNHLKINDLLSSAIRYCSYVKVETFVANLYGQTGLNIIKKQLDHVQCEKLLNGYVRFNHLVRAQCSKEQLNLKNLMKRCCAIQYKNKESGVDFVIPVIYSLSENSFDKMSAILVQTKLHSIRRKIYLDEVKKIQLSRSDIEPPFLVIYMQFGKSKQASVNDIGLKLKNRAVIFSEGISSQVFCSIDSDAETALINFSNSQNSSCLIGLDSSIEKEITFSSDLII